MKQDVWLWYAAVLLILALLAFGSLGYWAERTLAAIGLRQELTSYVPPNPNASGGGLSGLFERQGGYRTIGYAPNYPGLVVYAAIGALVTYRLGRR